MPGWDGYPVRERFAERYGAPVWVDNDVNILALGEWRSGIAVGHDNVVVVKIGTGIGAGIISNGRIHRGAQGAAGDVGHIQVVDAASIVCRCGNVGCLEALAGGAALARDGEAAAVSDRSERLRVALDQHGRVTAEDVARAASFGDPVAVGLLLAAGSSGRAHAGERRELLQPVADRGRRRRGPERRPAPGRHPRDRLPPLPAAGDPRPRRAAILARRRWPASSARRRWSSSSSSAATRWRAGGRRRDRRRARCALAAEG